MFSFFIISALYSVQNSFLVFLGSLSHCLEWIHSSGSLLHQMGPDNDWFLDDNPNLGFGVSGGLLPLEKTLTGSQILFSSPLNHASMWCSDRTVFIWLLHKQNILEYYVFLQRVPLTVCVCVSYMDQDILILQFKSQNKTPNLLV